MLDNQKKESGQFCPGYSTGMLGTKFLLLSVAAAASTSSASASSSPSIKLTKFRRSYVPDSAFSASDSWQAVSSSVCAAVAAWRENYFHSYDETNGVCSVGSADLTLEGDGTRPVMFKGT